MSYQHTPGPWQWQPTEDVDLRQIVFSADRIIARATMPGDAALIACSPDLWELAHDVISARVDYVSPVDYYKAMDEIADRAHRLIRKIEGRQA